MGVQRAREALDIAEQKGIGSSYGYDPDLVAFVGDTRHLKSVTLHEVSQVSFPANPHAPILDVKSRFYVPSTYPQWTNKAADALGWSTTAATSPPRYQRPAPQRQSQVWSELSGMSSRRRPIDPQATAQASAKAQHDRAMIAFNNAELLLHSLKERW
jgi:hypothetical protein